MMKQMLSVVVLSLCSVIQTQGATTAIDPDAVLDFATYLGGSDDDRAHGMAVDAQGNVYVTGPIRSRDFPTTATAVQKQPTGVYVAKLSTTGASLLLSTLIGAPGGANYAHGVAVDKEGCIYLAGNTINPRFPTTPGAFDTTYNGSNSPSHGDAFVVKLNPEGSEIIYATFLGGSGMDISGTVAVDAEGNAYILGCTSSPDFPATPGAYDTVSHGQEAYGRDDIFVAKLNPTGSELLYCTYIGGSSAEVYGGDIVIDSSGCAYVCGTTSSNDFPTTPGAYDTSYNGGTGHHAQGDAFLLKLNPAGTDLQGATFIGGSADDGATTIALDEKGNVYVAGHTKSADFPTTKDAWQRHLQGGQDGFFMTFSPQLDRLHYATLLGGTNDDRAQIGTSSSGLLFVSGSTESPDFPTTTDAHDRTFHGHTDLFISVFDPTAKALLYSTLLGGKGYDRACMRVDGTTVYLAGETTSRDFPVTAGAYDTTYNGGDHRFGGDVFIARLALEPALRNGSAKDRKLNHED
jgi:beta-propeller repeat-containing protein